MALGRFRFGVEGVDLRRAAIHEQMHDPLRLGRKVRPGTESCRPGGGGNRGLTDSRQATHRQRTEAHPAATQEVSAVEDKVLMLADGNGDYTGFAIVGTFSSGSAAYTRMEKIICKRSSTIAIWLSDLVTWLFGAPLI